MDKLQKIGTRSIIMAALLCSMMLIGVEAIAQCPMCRSAAESNLKAGGGNGRGLNAGILYMLAMPYLLVTTLGLLWWRNKRKNNLDLEN